MKKLIPLLILVALLLSGCGSDKPLTANYDITGTWEYSMFETTEFDMEEKEYDTGLITLSGIPTEGTYLLTNSDGVEYNGTYLVDRIVFGINGGDELRVKGSFTDDDHLVGTWENEDTGGLWTAVRK